MNSTKFWAAIIRRFGLTGWWVWSIVTLRWVTPGWYRIERAEAGPLGEPSPLWFTGWENRPGGAYDRAEAAWRESWEATHG